MCLFIFLTLKLPKKTLYNIKYIQHFWKKMQVIPIQNFIYNIIYQQESAQIPNITYIKNSILSHNLVLFLLICSIIQISAAGTKVMAFAADYQCFAEKSQIGTTLSSDCNESLWNLLLSPPYNITSHREQAHRDHVYLANQSQ